MAAKKPLETTRLETIGSAAAGIAHDLNNQLTLILNYLSIPDIDGANEAVSRCCELTSALLDFSSGSLRLMGPLDPAAFVHDFFTRTRLPDGVIPMLDTPEGMPAIDADPVALSRVLTNLISNASAAMKDCGLLRVIVGPGTICVEDTGKGISPQHLRNLFTPFFTTRGRGGTGLGLSIVRDIMRQHGGSVSVESKVGVGTRFRLKFRLSA